MTPINVKENGLSVTAYHGDLSVLLAFDMVEKKAINLAGFSIKCKTPKKGPYPTDTYYLTNRMNFKTGLIKDMALTPDLWMDKALLRAEEL